MTDDSGTLEGCIYERTARGGSGLSRGLRLERRVQELPRCLNRCRLNASIDANDNPCLIVADNDPCSRQGSRARMLGKQLMNLEDLNVIREGYSLPSSIVLSAPAAHETPRDNRLGHLCLNEHMLGTEVRIPFNFGVAEVLWAFNVPPGYIVPNSWKYYEHRGCLANRYLWRELLIRRSSQGYVEFLARRDVKGIDNPPDSVPGWESRFFFTRPTSEVDIWGILERWEESLPDPIPRSRLRERRAPKRVRPSGEEDNVVESDSSAEEALGSSSSGQLTPTSELEGTAPPSVVAQLKEELEASRAE
ncbi:hypothetical protein ACLOJK_040623, partial [Asimina triloba]